MLTCPKCNRNMYPVCSNKNCKCWKSIPAGELPMRDAGIIMGLKLKLYHYDFLWNFLRKVGKNPAAYIFEIEECPYCKFGETIDYWEDRNIEQTFPNGFPQYK